MWPPPSFLCHALCQMRTVQDHHEHNVSSQCFSLSCTHVVLLLHCGPVSKWNQLVPKYWLRQKNNEWHQKCWSPPRRIATSSCERIFIRLSQSSFQKTCRKRWKRVAKVTSPRHSGGSYDLSYFFFFKVLPWQQGMASDKCEKVAVLNFGTVGSMLIWCLCVSQKRLNHQFTLSVICLCDSHSVFTSTVWATAALHVLWLDLNSRLRNVRK